MKLAQKAVTIHSDTQPDNAKRQNFDFLSISAAVVCAAISGITLIGWLCHIPYLIQPWMGQATMKANAALCLLLSAVSIICIHLFRRTTNNNWEQTGKSLAALVALISAATIVEYWTGRNLGIDQLVTIDWGSQKGTYAPGRMGANAAIMFTIFGAGRWLLSPANRQFRRTGFALIVSVAIAACFSLVGYFYGVPHLYKISSFTEMAMSAATAFALIASSMLTAFTNEGPIAVLATNTAGAIVARRLLPVAIFLPPIIGFARLHGEQLGFYSSEFGVAIMVLSMMLAMTTLAYWIAHAVDREDITRKYAAALSASEERYRSITDSVNDAIVSADSNNKITFVNTAFTSIFKYAPSEVIGKPLTLLMPSRFQADHNAGIHRFLTTGESRIIGKTVELAGITKEGKEFPLELSVGTWKDAEQSWFTAIIRDISERKNAEEQAKRLQFLSAREDFLAVLMHNLKNPIIGADRVFDALTSKMKGSLTPDLEKIISELQRNNKNVLDMMNELIEVYQYETDPRSIERKKTDVALLVRNSINDARAMADNHGVDVILIKEDNHEDALLAPVGVGRIIKNLLDNAIKFSDNGGCVRVSVRSIGPSIEISVHNYGKTISPEEKDMLFRGFWRGVAGKTLPPGTGLGLYLCRVIVEAHQGSITCTSNDGEGTTFSVVLPST